MRLKGKLKMNRLLLLLLVFACSCNSGKNQAGRIPVAKAGNSILYHDQLPGVEPGMAPADSAASAQEFIDRWAHKELMYQKAEENLSPERREEIDLQMKETRQSLAIYQYQRQMILEKMDTIISDAEMENYYMGASQSFTLGFNIVQALFIKVPFETPQLGRIRTLARSIDPKDLIELESLCYQFAERFDDFDEKWVPFDRIAVELPYEINNEEYFIRRTTFYETTDSIDVFFLKIRDYRLKSTTAPFDYVKEDIKSIIWNTRRLEFIQNLEKGIYDNAIEQNKLTLYN